MTPILTYTLPPSSSHYVEALESSFNGYLDVWSRLLKRPTEWAESYQPYGWLWKRLFMMKPEFITRSSLRLLAIQLLTGCRASAAVRAKSYWIDGELRISILHLKGGATTRFHHTALPTPFAALFLETAFVEQHPSYPQYRRELRASNPSFFMKAIEHHLSCTHLVRYFVVQLLHYCFKLPLTDLQHLLGWTHKESIKSYLDRNLWYCWKGV